MRATTLLAGVIWLAPSIVLAAQQDFNITVESAHDNAFSLAARYLQCFAVENPTEYIPFLRYLVDSGPSPTVKFSAPQFAKIKGLDGKVRKSKYDSISPIFTRLLQPSETYEYLRWSTARSGKLRGRGERTAHALALANGQADSDLRVMQLAYEKREQELQEPRNKCESWIDLRGHKICSPTEFWPLMGAQQKKTAGALTIETSGDDLKPLPFDHVFPREVNETLPFVVLYGATTDEALPALFKLLHALAEPKTGSPRLQFAVRWKSDSMLDVMPHYLSDFSAEIDLSSSVKRPTSNELEEIRLRAAAHILASSDPLAAFVSLSTNTPLVVPRLKDFVPEIPTDLADRLNSHHLQPSFTINGVALPLEHVDMPHILQALRTERRILAALFNAHHGIKPQAAREMVLAAGRVPHDTEKDTRAGIKTFDLSKIGNGLPHWIFEATAYMEGDSAGADVEVTSPIASIFVIADLDSKNGRRLARSALEYLTSDTKSRLTFLHNPKTGSTPSHAHEPSNYIGSLIVDREFAEVFPSELSAWLALDVGGSGLVSPDSNDWDADSPLAALARAGATQEQAEAAQEYWAAMTPVARQLGVEAGQSAVVVNGRVLKLKSGALSESEFARFVEDEIEQRIRPIVEAGQLSLAPEIRAERSGIARANALATSIVSLATDAAKEPRDLPYGQLPVDYPSFIAGNTTSQNALYEIGIVVDPLSSTARYWAPILRTVAKVGGVRLKVYLAQWDDTEYDLFDSVYGASTAATITFKKEDTEEIAPSVRFSGLPEGDTSRISVAVPDAGTVELVKDEMIETEDGTKSRQLAYRYTPESEDRASDSDRLVLQPSHDEL